MYTNKIKNLKQEITRKSKLDKIKRKNTYT